ncbi:unnamed protein product [Mytilus edulis]|uniref:Uncharacterized protein n=1 Tax=Mytilus edulis TaxID=6550 RepID=A0A8S3PYG3_MYTED|nr:unnamed protein product [Mytilus edulis]
MIQASCLSFILLFYVKANAEFQGEEFVNLAKQMIAYTANQILQNEELAQANTNLIPTLPSVESIPNWIISNEDMLVQAIENATISDNPTMLNEYELAANMVDVIANEITIHQKELNEGLSNVKAFNNPAILVATWIESQKDIFAEAVVNNLGRR